MAARITQCAYLSRSNVWVLETALAVSPTATKLLRFSGRRHMAVSDDMLGSSFCWFAAAPKTSLSRNIFIVSDHCDGDTVSSVSLADSLRKGSWEFTILRSDDTWIWCLLSLYIPKRHPAATEQVPIVVGEAVVLKTTIDPLTKKHQVQGSSFYRCHKRFLK